MPLKINVLLQVSQVLTSIQSHIVYIGSSHVVPGIDTIGTIFSYYSAETCMTLVWWWLCPCLDTRL